jgi:2-keto-4-pentenoate hydratase
VHCGGAGFDRPRSFHPGRAVVVTGPLAPPGGGHVQLPPELSDRGRRTYGPTPPSGAVPCKRTAPLSPGEVEEVVAIIAAGRLERRAAELPERLWTRDWGSVVKVVIGVDKRLGLAGAGWKIGAASEEIRRAEQLPSPSPGRIYGHTIFQSGAQLGPELFINYRNCECEYAFELGLEFAPREAPYTEADVRAGIGSVFPALELGDSVFLDWYGASAYFGSCLDNGGGAAFVEGRRVKDWQQVDFTTAGMDLFLNGYYIKSGRATAAMGHPVTSLTWLVNWARERGLHVAAGEVVSTGTCTGHLFAGRNDTVVADFGELGVVEAHFS